MAVVSVLVAVFAPVIATHNPAESDYKQSLLPPSASHWMGTDHLGMDIYSRVVYAARVDLVVAGAGVLLAASLGTLIGGISGYAGGLTDEIIMRFLDSQQAFPMYILAMALMIAIGQNLANIVVVLALINYPLYARLVRAQMLSVKQSQYADAARCMGCSPVRIVLKHLLPNCIGPVYVQASLNAGWALLLSAGLSFLGLGVEPPTAEWGSMISAGRRYIPFGQWWVSIFPGIAIFIAVLGFNLLGDGLQDVFDPKRR